MRRRLAPAERKQELLTFGRAFFADHPVDAGSMDELAAGAGVSKGLIYKYFGCRRGFYVATVEAIAREVSALTEPREDGPFELAFLEVMSRYLGWVRAHAGDYRVLVQGGLGVDPEVSTILARLRRELATRILSRLGVVPDSKTNLATYGWVCFAEHACLDWLDRDDVTEGDMLGVLTGALQGALRGAGMEASGA
ncbi:MAG: TetR/AcrR family transcriptional regulator [Myxococcota bacterium]